MGSQSVKMVFSNTEEGEREKEMFIERDHMLGAALSRGALRVHPDRCHIVTALCRGPRHFPQGLAGRRCGH